MAKRCANFSIRQAAEAGTARLQEQWKREKELVGEDQGEAARVGRRAPTGGNRRGSRAASCGDNLQTLQRPTRSIRPPAAAQRPPQLPPRIGLDAPTATPLSDEQKQTLREELRRLEKATGEIQGEHALVYPCVNSQAVAETVSAWTGIPLGRMVANEIQTVLKLKSLMEESIVGQSHALEEIAQRIRTSRANLSDPRTPIGVFLLCGTSGVGKTETAITLANFLYGGEQNMTVINMSEFKEEHKVSLLMGSPPGYVGYGEGGVLTEAVRRKPYSVVLLDEMEKAHPGVQDIFYQVFDKGMMKDGEGRDIDFKNTVIMMTTNAGTDFIKGLCGDPDTCPGRRNLQRRSFPEL
jgi:type VI secretion system protein VasG